MMPWLRRQIFEDLRVCLSSYAGFAYNLANFQKRREISENHAASSNYSRDPGPEVPLSRRRSCSGCRLVSERGFGDDDGCR
jgi:hypothetical protein